MRRLHGSPMVALVALLSLHLLPGCMKTTDGSVTSTGSLTTIDGLERVEIAMPGLLEIRPDHGIGSYDAILIPKTSLSYSRSWSARLTDEAERAFLRHLRQTLVDAVAAAAIPIETTPGQCVMTVSLTVHDLVVDPSDRAERLGQMILVMEFRDSSSRQTLLRYGVETRVENPEASVTHDHRCDEGSPASSPRWISPDPCAPQALETIRFVPDATERSPRAVVRPRQGRAHEIRENESMEEGLVGLRVRVVIDGLASAGTGGTS